MPASIRATQNQSEKNVFTFEVTDLPALTSNSNEPLPFYQFFWDFGDGHFSTAPMPSHTYPEISRSYSPSVKVRKVNNNTGSSVPDISTTVNVSTNGGGHFVSQPAYSSLLAENERAGMKVITPAVASEQIYCLISYHNPSANPLNVGRLVLQYNENSTGEGLLTFQEIRVFNGETHSLVSNPPGSDYLNEIRIDFDGIIQGDFRNLCVVFDVSNSPGSLTNTKLNLQVFDPTGNPMGSSFLTIPIVNMINQMEAVIGEDVTVTA